jgi:hypothetical protein
LARPIRREKKRGGPHPASRRAKSSEVELQRELDDARIGRAQNLAEARGIARDIRRTEVRAIERIEQFGAELEAATLAQMEIFREREVEVDAARAAHDADARRAEGLRRGRERGLERIGVELARLRALRFGQNGIANQGSMLEIHPGEHTRRQDNGNGMKAKQSTSPENPTSPPFDAIILAPPFLCYFPM